MPVSSCQQEICPASQLMANKEKKKEKKREVLQLTLSVTMTYPPPPAIATQPLPPLPPKTTAVADGMTDNDNFSSDEENTIDQWHLVTPEDKMKQKRNEHVACNAKQAKKDNATAQQNANRSANIQQG